MRGEPLLIDWRAPAARPFYAATAAHPMGGYAGDGTSGSTGVAWWASPTRSSTLRADPALDTAITELWPRLTREDVVQEVLAEARPESGCATGAGWTVADLPLLDEAELVDGPTADVYGHVVVDEAQELTEMEWRAVLRRCPSRSALRDAALPEAGGSP
jgi:hypothetical protein